MLCSIILLVFFLIFCESNDFKCGYWNDNMESIEFYYTAFDGSVPVHCSTSFSPTNLTKTDKSKVKELKIRGYYSDRINEFIQDYPNLYSLEASYCNIDWFLQLPKIDHRNLEILNMSHSQIQSFGRFHISELPKLTELDLSYNMFEYVPMLNTEMHKLVKLNLSHNNLYGVFDLQLFDSMESIDFSYNFIRYFNYGKIILGFKSLMSLHLENNLIQSFDCKILSRVKRGLSLNISWNNIQHFDCTEENTNFVTSSNIEGVFPASDGTIKLHCNDQSFSKITVYEVNGENNLSVDITKCLTSSLKTLYLSGDLNGKLNNNTFKRFINLEELEIRETKLSNFDFGWLRKQKHLKRLYVSKDSFKTMTNLAYVKTFEELENVTIMENQLENMGEFFQYVNRSVKYININGNSVGVLYNRHLKNLDNLISLSLNNLEGLSLSELFILESSHYINLQFLDISYNILGYDSRVQFRFMYQHSFPSLKTLNAAYCAIRNINEFLMFRGYFSLKHLRLSGNHMEDVRTYLNTSRNLEYLHLDNMNASTFDIGMLFDSLSLKFLNVSYNNMKTMDLNRMFDGITSNFSQLEELYLEGNDLVDPVDLNPKRFPKLQKLAVAKNQFSCRYLLNLMQTNWPGATRSVMVGEYLQQKHENCAITIQKLMDETDGDKKNEVQNTTPDTNLESKLEWLYITIGSLILIIIIIIFCVCLVFRKRLFKKTTPNHYGKPTVFWKGNKLYEPVAELAKPEAENIYESIPDLEEPPYSRLNYLPRNPNSKNIVYATHLKLKKRRSSM